MYSANSMDASGCAYTGSLDLHANLTNRLALNCVPTL